jgi:hypothetical protein
VCVCPLEKGALLVIVLCRGTGATCLTVLELQELPVCLSWRKKNYLSDCPGVTGATCLTVLELQELPVCLSWRKKNYLSDCPGVTGATCVFVLEEEELPV